MRRVLKNKLALCVLVVLVVAPGVVFAADVIVDGNGDVVVGRYLYGQGTYLEVVDRVHTYYDLDVEDGALFENNTAVIGDLYVSGDVDADEYNEHSSFYDKEVYGPALDYLADSLTIITINDQGEKEYNRAADPAFLQRWVELEDREKFTEAEVWDEDRQKMVIERVYETHEEPHSSLSMKVA